MFWLFDRKCKAMKRNKRKIKREETKEKLGNLVCCFVCIDDDEINLH